MTSKEGQQPNEAMDGGGRRHPRHTCKTSHCAASARQLDASQRRRVLTTSCRIEVMRRCYAIGTTGRACVLPATVAKRDAASDQTGGRVFSSVDVLLTEAVE